MKNRMKQSWSLFMVMVMVLSLLMAPAGKNAYAHEGEWDEAHTCEHNCDTIEKIHHAQPGSDGWVDEICEECGEVVDDYIIYAPEEIDLSRYSYTYDGKKHKPHVAVYDSDWELIDPEFYSVTYADSCKDAGKYTVKVTFSGYYKGSLKEEYTITKAKQKLTVKNYSKTAASSSFKVSVKGAKGKLSYKTSNSKVAKISSSGKVTIKGPGYAKITVNAASTKNYKSAKKTFTVGVKPKKVSSVSVKNNVGSQKLKVSWKKQSRVSKYQVRYAKNSSFDNAKTVTVSAEHTSKTLSGLSKGTKYYVQVRAVKSSNEHTYKGAWSSTKSATTKKATSSTSSSSHSTNKTNTNSAGPQVYITPTGSCYHTHACGRGSYSPVSLSYAKSLGLRPCSKCY